MSFIRKNKKKKNVFEGDMPIDNPDVKVVTSSYRGNPFFVGVGTSKQRDVKGLGQAGWKEGVKGAYESQKDLDWQLFYNLDALPKGFVPAEKLKDFMASAVTFTSGNASAYSPQTKFVETDPNELRKLERKTKTVKRQIRAPKTLEFVDLVLKELANEERKKKRRTEKKTESEN